MKKQRILKLILIGIVALFAISMLGLFIWSRTGTYPARSTAIAALASTNTVTVTQDDWIAFTPLANPQTGLIFYPGGLVEPTAYAPVLHRIAQGGVLVVIAPMPLNLAILNIGVADDIISAFPSIDSWILAGHSLGGASAAIFAENNPESIDAMVFWDSYPPNSASLSDNGLPILSIFGTTNGTPNTEGFDERKYLLPENTEFIAIEGANHAQFGDYGPQKDDVLASITLDEQHEIVTAIMLDFILQD